ncbi:RNA polymerase sigma factor SigJ [Naasia aerilata]|uniref:RNA polymerase sigma24 factor n=1 Tax=Naasia aerilata TaxID=1162966 RepID=A0ABM8G8J1_9MICO|nr:RNA polymerase sigma factor SigJ [Naasia aerilata]BDZ44422.1 RNA polymerase sigma24 factor [Naasia aerilata]
MESVSDVAFAERRALVGLAYRILGTVQDAEDAAQETLARWSQLSDAQRAAIESPRAWLLRVAGRVALNMATSARARREEYVGEWLPEPANASWLLGTPSEDPADRAAQSEAVSMALLVVLQSLSPAERVAFVLHDVFAVPFREIADVLSRSEEASRQLATSARRRVRERQAGEVDAGTHGKVLAAFLRAAETGDLGALIAVLSPGVELRSDGGGRVSAALRPVQGSDRVARFVLGVTAKNPDGRVSIEPVGGVPAAVIRVGTAPLAVVTLSVVAGVVEHVWLTMNPDKLTTWTQ